MQTRHTKSNSNPKRGGGEEGRRRGGEEGRGRRWSRGDGGKEGKKGEGN